MSRQSFDEEALQILGQEHCDEALAAHCGDDAAFRAGRAAPLEVHAEANSRARHRDDESSSPRRTDHILPAFPDQLLALPYGLGDLQAWIYGFMSYPCLALAGVTAWATFAHFSMTSVRIDSRRGLGVNEQFLLLAPTGFGKEDLRAPFEILTHALEDVPRPEDAPQAWTSRVARIQHSAPASQQGLHRILESHAGQTFLADEFAEWLGHTANDSHKQQALQHIMQAYGRAFGTLSAPAAVTTEYKPVQNPRVLVFATSTAERILETITASQADSGALNRFVVLAGEQGTMAKRYGVKGSNFRPPAELVELIAWVVSREAIAIRFAPDAWKLYQEHDSTVLDPLKFRDHRLAGRLNEQSFKLAALIALSDKRNTIDADDLAVAYAVREGLYHRAAAMIGYDGALSGMHATGRALEQLRQHFRTKPVLYRSNLEKVSRRFKALSIQERDAVVRALQAEEIVDIDGARLVSRIYETEAP